MRRQVRQRFWLPTLMTMACWTGVLAGSLAWEWHLLAEQDRHLARFQAEGAFKRDLVYRAWNARMGGVYAQVSLVDPNPYLEVENRDLDSSIGPLTLVNPSYMTRMVHELAAERTGLRSHITSLDPLRPANAPSGWEREALKAFEQDRDTAYTALAHDADGTAILRFMRPLVVEEACMTCHEKQGYQLGDIRGGISVTVPLAPIQEIQAPSRSFSMIAHGSVWLLGMFGIGLSGRAMARLVGRLEDAREQALNDRARAEEADQAKSRFLATMSHELRTPLNAILGFSDIMRQQMFGPLGDRRYNTYAHDIHVSGEHLLALINDVLDLSRIEAGRLDLADERVNLIRTIEETVEVLRPQAEQQDLRLDVQLDPRMPDVRADERVVRQMVINLVANAMRFTPAGGRIVVAANIDGQGRAMIAVTDTGSGIPEEEHHIVLQPFRQGSHATHGARGGTGLGLPLVKGFIEKHGGSLDLFSEVGRGTTVKLFFPPSRLIVSAD